MAQEEDAGLQVLPEGLQSLGEGRLCRLEGGQQRRLAGPSQELVDDAAGVTARLQIADLASPGVDLL